MWRLWTATTLPTTQTYNLGHPSPGAQRRIVGSAQHLRSRVSCGKPRTARDSLDLQDDFFRHLFLCVDTFPLYVENPSDFFVARNQAETNRREHIVIQGHPLGLRKRNSTVNLLHLSSKRNISDILTGRLDKSASNRLKKTSKSLPHLWPHSEAPEWVKIHFVPHCIYMSALIGVKSLIESHLDTRQYSM